MTRDNKRKQAKSCSSERTKVEFCNDDDNKIDEKKKRENYPVDATSSRSTLVKTNLRCFFFFPFVS